MGEPSVPAEVTVGRTGESVVLRVQGRCTACSCDALQGFVRQIDRATVPDLYFDLEHADWIDSTFAGFLMALAVGKAGPAVPTVHLLRPSEHARDALRKLHVLRLFDVRDDVTPRPEEWQPLNLARPPADALGDLVVRSHEALIEADQRNAPTLGPVVEGFRNRAASPARTQGSPPGDDTQTA